MRVSGIATESMMKNIGKAIKLRLSKSSQSSSGERHSLFRDKGRRSSLALPIKNFDLLQEILSEHEDQDDSTSPIKKASNYKKLPSFM